MTRLSLRFVGIALVLFVSLVCLPSRAGAQEGGSLEEPWQLIGVWNLDFALSPLFDGAPPQTRTLKYWWEGDHYKHTVHVVNAKGEHTLGGWETDRNIKTIAPPTTTVKRLDTHTSQIINHRDGKLTNLLTRIRWKDGKHVTFVRQRPDANGQLEVYGVEVFVKQDTQDGR